MVGSLARMVKDEPTDAAPVATPFAELTAREQEILLHVAEGQSNKMIARALNITDGTVKPHVKSVLAKARFALTRRSRGTGRGARHGKKKQQKSNCSHTFRGRKFFVISLARPVETNRVFHAALQPRRQ